jgi:hypothetical protein
VSPERCPRSPGLVVPVVEHVSLEQINFYADDAEQLHPLDATWDYPPLPET